MGFNEKKIIELIRTGETDTIEFKASIPPVNILCKVIAAFANTHGGVFLLGVHEQHGIVGIMPGDSQKVMQAITHMENPPKYECTEVAIDGKTVLAIEIQPNVGKLTHCQGGLYCRKGDRICLMDEDDIRRYYQDISQPQEVGQLTSSIALMNKSICKLTEQVQQHQEEVQRHQEEVKEYQEQVRQYQHDLEKANKSSAISSFVYWVLGVVLGALASALITIYL